MSVNIFNKSTGSITQIAGNATGGGGGTTVTVDNILSTASENPVQNKVITEELNKKIDSSIKGAANGVAELDSNGKVLTAQLPSYVDDVLEYTDISVFPTVGETGKIYVDTTTNKTYRWSGSTYIEISESIALGETSSTAYRGDRGKIAYDHSQSAHAPADAEANVQADWNETDTTSDAYILNKPSSLPANGGNADTVGGKNTAQLMTLGMNYADRTKISEGDLNNYTNAGRFVVTTSAQASAISNSPFTNSGYYLDVYHRATGYYTQIAMNWRGLVKIRSCMDSTWGEWKNISDGGNADTLGGYDKSKFFRWVADKNTKHDCNDCTDSGWYFFNGCGGHAPGSNSTISSGTYFILWTYRYNNSYLAQTAMFVHGLSDYLGKTYTRYCNNGEWSNWINIADGGNANTVNGRSTSGNSSLIRYDSLSSATDANTLISTGIYAGIFTNYPSGARDGQGTLVVINYKAGNDEATGTMGDTTGRWINQWFITPHTNDVYCRSCVHTIVSDWVKTNDGGAAATATYSSFANNASTLADTTSNVCLRDIYAGTTDMTAGTTALKTGAIYLVYE